MIALISPAKTMREGVAMADSTEPRFAAQSEVIASAMLVYSVDELSQIFKVSYSIAKQLKGRFRGYFDDAAPRASAIDSYDGVVYRHIRREGEQLSSEQRGYLQSRVRISSLLYGLLRPLDQIKPYRMEGFVRLAGADERVDRVWRDIQTRRLIDDVETEGGELIYLASQEEQNAFHWREVRRQCRVIEVLFLQPKGDKLRQIVVYTKMARGEMVRYMMRNNISDSEALKHFEWSGYRYNEELSSENRWVWLLE